MNKINRIRLNNPQPSATLCPTVHLNRFSLLVGTLLRKKDIAPRYVCEHCAASQQFNAFNNHRQTYTARRSAVRHTMTTYNPFGGVW